jgi:subtilisin family serine protease
MGTLEKDNFPADARDMITVGSISPNGVNAAFCAVGPTADGRVKPDVMAYGSPATVITGRGTIINDMGTSFSAPLVTGLIACLWEALPHKTALEMIDLVRQSGNQYTTPDNIYGYGVPDFWKAYVVGKANEHQR